ncbi:MAG: N-acetyl-gamma-glutamyl-phosphate reductase [Clostridiales Family XIII bacterium]|jgi:N-acetyl-gamma-glutamyl-phosphate reductase|nr:N-acetyl-gamma-glutamyl-phosphate reductase [Clostridiales Family XIII bacterium]
MKKYKVFIDGHVGTTGLKIDEYLKPREDIEVLGIEEEVRKDPEARLAKMKQADITFLCLPDDEAREIAKQIPPGVRVIDASTAHRTHPDWVYGMPELTPTSREQIRHSNRVALPGCHATGFILLVRPLIDGHLVAPDYPFTVHSITGYSGGGKKMIECYRDYEKEKPVGVLPERPKPVDLFAAPRLYALKQVHKHLPEMTAMADINYPPVFTPHVADYFSGMNVVVPLHRRLLPAGTTISDVRHALEMRYRKEPFVKVRRDGANPEDGFLSAAGMQGRDRLEIYITGNWDRILLVARFDNLGKGASGAGIQCMNIMLGLEEESGLS